MKIYPEHRLESKDGKDEEVKKHNLTKVPKDNRQTGKGSIPIDNGSELSTTVIKKKKTLNLGI